MIAQNWLPSNVHLLRRLPINWQLASVRATAAIDQLQPDVIICCGMAESQPFLTVESQGKSQAESLSTGIDLTALLAGTIAALLIAAMNCPHPQPFSLGRREPEVLFPLPRGEG